MDPPAPSSSALETLASQPAGTTQRLRALAVSRPPRNVVARLWSQISAPTRAIVDPAERRSARLLAKIAIAMAGLNVWASIQTIAFAPQPVRRMVAGTLLPGATLFLAAYVASRSRRWRIALPLLVATQALEPVVISSWIGTFDEAAGLSLAGWLFLSVLTGASMLPARSVLWLGAGAMSGLLAVLLGIGGAGPDVAGQPVILLASLTVITAVVVRHRDTLEAVRQQEILLRNAELEDLRNALEDRVAERTRRLEESHAALTCAFESLESNQRARVHAEKMAAIGRMTAGIAHEMASPLGAMVASLDSIQKLANEYARSVGHPEVTPSDHLEIAREMLEAADLAATGAERCTAFVRGLRAQTREDARDRPSRFDVVATVRDALRFLSHLARAARVEVSLTGSRTAELTGAAGRLAQAVSNVVRNAIDATGERGGGKVRVHIEDGPESIRIEIQDEGTGISKTNLPRVFEPFFTTKPFGNGTGLGLSIVKEAIEEDLGGRIEVRSERGRGTSFVLHLPRKDAPSHAA
jgi:signal transduction histidine kinase